MRLGGKKIILILLAINGLLFAQDAFFLLKTLFLGLLGFPNEGIGFSLLDSYGITFLQILLPPSALLFSFLAIKKTIYQAPKSFHYSLIAFSHPLLPLFLSILTFALSHFSESAVYVHPLSFLFTIPLLRGLVGSVGLALSFKSSKRGKENLDEEKHMTSKKERVKNNLSFALMIIGSPIILFGIFSTLWLSMQMANGSGGSGAGMFVDLRVYTILITLVGAGVFFIGFILKKSR